MAREENRWPFPRNFDGIVEFQGIAGTQPSCVEDGTWKLEKGSYRLVSPKGRTAILPQNVLHQNGITYEYAILVEPRGKKLYYWVRFAGH